MAAREAARDELLSGSSFTSASTGLFKMAGGWGNVNGPGIFMIRVLFAGSATAITTGMVGGIIGGLTWGTSSLPFIASACAGFLLGTAGFYHDAVSKSLLALERYPALLRLHLDANYPEYGFRRRGGTMDADTRLAAFRTSWTLQSMLVVSWLTAQPALDRIIELEEEAIITELGNAAATTDTTMDGEI